MCPKSLRKSLRGMSLFLTWIKTKIDELIIDSYTRRDGSLCPISVLDVVATT
jgi:hypothetical protein